MVHGGYTTIEGWRVGTQTEMTNADVKLQNKTSLQTKKQTVECYKPNNKDEKKKRGGQNKSSKKTFIFISETQPTLSKGSAS